MSHDEALPPVKGFRLEFNDVPDWYHCRNRIIDGFDMYLHDFGPIVSILEVPFDLRREFMGYADSEIPRDLILRRMLPRELDGLLLTMIFEYAEKFGHMRKHWNMSAAQIVEDLLRRQTEDQAELTQLRENRAELGRLVGQLS
jgi:hypothetical protein